MKTIRKVNRTITKTDKKMAKRANIIIEKISSDDLKNHHLFGKVIRKLVNSGFDGGVFELHCQGSNEMLWIKEDFGLVIGMNLEGKICYGVTVNIKIDEGMVGAFVRLLRKNNIEHQITHAISFDDRGNPTIQPAIVQKV